MKDETILIRKTKKLMDLIKFTFLKQRSIAWLCDEYGNPQDVRDYLQQLSDDNRLLAIFVKENIRELDQMIEEDSRRHKEAYEEYLLEKQTHASGCVDCPFGNGEGGCTIPPGSCNWDEEYGY